ncbi:DUF3394 domain-containing protein, partial [Vibrio parahaemolyticus]|uniref:DUF3394 domain-containing protein n=1 Tax=Vibrio parahaemolyticus TaxID=670 RepID=UPI001EEAC2D2
PSTRYLPPPQPAPLPQLKSVSLHATPDLTLPENGSSNRHMVVDMVEFGSPAESSGIDFDWEIKWVVQDADRPMKEWVFVPCLILLLVLAMNQKRRARKEQLSA